METPREWRPDKGMREKDVAVRTVVSLSQAQCDALATLSGPLGPTQRLWIQQTVTEPGGTHLYVRDNHNEMEWHIGVDGNAICLGIVPQGAEVMRCTKCDMALTMVPEGGCGDNDCPQA